MFGYALGLELSHRCTAPLNLLVEQRPGGSPAISSLDLPDDVQLVPHHAGTRRDLLWQLGRLSPHGRLITERRAGLFDPRVLEARPPTTLFGFFQSWRYFPSVADKLEQQLLGIQSPSREFEAIRDELEGIRPFVGVQVRRGDYLGLQDYHGLASDRYFSQALRLINPERLPVVAFTDDQSGWRPNWLSDGQKPDLVLSPSDVPDARETLMLLASSERLVISNSSFGWWGAWLGSRRGAPVIAPRPWFASREKDTRDLLPLEWITLDLRER